jgi:2-polyprenyl-6-methoxyphenol hydroxylase-like FAD-dependent oxidoreductase
MRVVIVGAGPIGLATAILLARDGHEVTLLEKDAQAAPATALEAWERWERTGVGQFRQLHFMQPRFRQLLDGELPEVRDEIEATGGRRFSLIDSLASSLADRAPRPGDERFETLTGRRPVLESAFARVAESTSGVTIRRGIAVDGPITGRSVLSGIPHVAGVRTRDGVELIADLVIDAMGRRSKLTEWVTALGGRAPYEEASDRGFAYYTRHFRSRDGSLPEARGPIGVMIGSIRVMTVPADNNAWTMAIAAMAGDRPLKALRHNEVWERVARSVPHAAHWLDGEPLCDVIPMAGVLDRYRRIVVDDQLVVTGLLPVGDSWACTNPMAGRGFSLGLAQAIALRDAAREFPEDLARLAEAFDRVTEETLTPWYRDQMSRDAQRAAEVRRIIDGRAPAPPADDPASQMQRAVLAAADTDPEVARGFLDVMSCLALPNEVMSRPGLRERAAAYIGVESPEMPGPTRAELLSLVS